MSRKMIKLGLILLILLASTQVAFGQALSSRGAPGSPEFGIGATLYPQGTAVKDALNLASTLGLDWLSVPVDWAASQPVSTTLPDLEFLDQIMQSAAKNHIAVMVSISNAPAWAKTSRGPDPAYTARFVLYLYRSYSEALQAVELFPGANTLAGWGSQPDPRAYYQLFKQVAEQARGPAPALWLVAAGLRPQEAHPLAGNMDDLEFLKGLYQQGASALMPVISLQYDALTGDPLRFPDGSERRIYRHYEEVRQVMVANQHQTGLIWITHLSLPSGTINPSDFAYQNLNAQASWLKQAYMQTRSQLYVGVTFGQSLNSEAEDTAAGAPGLLLPGSSGFHQFCSVLREIIALNKNGGAALQSGKPKEECFFKQP